MSNKLDEQEKVPFLGFSIPLAIGIVSLVCAICALIWCHGLSNQLASADQRLADAKTQNALLIQSQAALAEKVRAGYESLDQSVGLTQRQVQERTQNLVAAQAAAQHAQLLNTARLEAEQASSANRISDVASDVITVKTDVGGAKSDIAATRNDLESTKTQLQRTMGDAGVMSGLIARNHDELEVLKHRGDRNYFEFSLQKGAKPVLLSTIKIAAKKVDDKRSRYTLLVSADDRNIEKKDKSLDEPVQFYTGKDPVLYEIVVNSIAKNQIGGYLAVPKGAQQPMAAPTR